LRVDLWVYLRLPQVECLEYRKSSTELRALRVRGLSTCGYLAYSIRCLACCIRARVSLLAATSRLLYPCPTLCGSMRQPQPMKPGERNSAQSSSGGNICQACGPELNICQACGPGAPPRTHTCTAHVHKWRMPVRRGCIPLYGVAPRFFFFFFFDLFTTGDGENEFLELWCVCASIDIQYER
jgi:hypothetical protein